jgi:hypothetical protein
MKGQTDLPGKFLHQFYSESKARLAEDSVDQLVNTFNRETTCKGWTGTRGAFLRALMDTFEEKGVNISSVSDYLNGYKSTSFKYPVFLTKGKDDKPMLKQIIEPEK